ncbi:MAG: serine/threonine protein kinase [Burkholderiaceae bacterium]|nr:serine/threonine protein kinase [Rhodoferax sp.]MCP5284814.1 serine/threonine protein kinase [Burkholderiaceae bacterium]
MVARELGRGSQSIVHAAFDERAHAWRALKLLLPQDGSDTIRRAAAGKRLQQELAHVRRLDHPGIVRVHDSGETRGLHWLTMELLPGTDLTRYTRPSRRLPAPVVAAIGARLAEALAHAHGAGIVHRDLKPANVIIDWASDRVVITDFGLARSAGAERTRTGLVLGSPAYMAPELLAGQTPSPASDLYALGVLLFQLLAGRLPYDAPGLGELLRAVATAPVPALSPLMPPPHDPQLPALEAVVTSLLAKSPEARPDAAATARALRALLPLPVAADAAGVAPADGQKSRGLPD